MRTPMYKIIKEFYSIYQKNKMIYLMKFYVIYTIILSIMILLKKLKDLFIFVKIKTFLEKLKHFVFLIFFQVILNIIRI